MTRRPPQSSVDTMAKDRKPDADSKQAIDDVQMMLRSLGLADFGYQDEPQPDGRPSWAPARVPASPERRPSQRPQSQAVSAQIPVEKNSAKKSEESKRESPRAPAPQQVDAPAVPANRTLHSHSAPPKSVPQPGQALEQPRAEDKSVSLREAFSRLAAKAPAAKPKGLKLQLDKVPQASSPARSVARNSKRDLRSVFGRMTARPPKTSG